MDIYDESGSVLGRIGDSPYPKPLSEIAGATKARETIRSDQNQIALLREACLACWPIVQYYAREGQHVNASPSVRNVRDAYHKLQEALK